MSKSIDFYEALGGEIVFGSRDGDWTLMQFGSSAISLLAHRPGDGKRETVELQFVSTTPLDEIEAYMKLVNVVAIDRRVADEAFGRMLKLRTADGLLIKVLELERDLIEQGSHYAKVRPFLCEAASFRLWRQHDHSARAIGLQPIR